MDEKLDLKGLQMNNNNYDNYQSYQFPEFRGKGYFEFQVLMGDRMGEL